MSQQERPSGFPSTAVREVDAPLRVSIIIPVYNRLRFLDETLNAVLAQTLTDWELVIVDDGSEENVEEFLRRYLDHRITLLRQANQGNAAARNTGIQRARGEYIICLDSDDVWHPDMLPACVAALEAHPDIDVVYTRFRTINAEGVALPTPVSPEPQSGNLLEPLLMGYPILPSSALARRCCFERWGMYKPGLDDWELWLRWAAIGCRFMCIEKPLLYYRIHDQNFNLDWSRRRQAHFAMLDAFYQQKDLPAVAIQMRNRVYANQHLHFAVLAWQVGRPADGVAEFSLAVHANPDLLEDLDFHTGIACAHQGRIDAGTIRGLDLEAAQRALVQSLDALFAETDLPAAIRRKQAAAFGWAYLALARLTYSGPHDMLRTRCFLLRSFAAWPPLAWQTDWATWLARALIGYETVQCLKQRLQISKVSVRHAQG